jgi:hypothetical protein
MILVSPSSGSSNQLVILLGLFDPENEGSHGSKRRKLLAQRNSETSPKNIIISTTAVLTFVHCDPGAAVPTDSWGPVRQNKVLSATEVKVSTEPQARGWGEGGWEFGEYMKGKSLLPVQNVTQRNRPQSIHIKILVLPLSIKHETNIDQEGARSGRCPGSLGLAQSPFTLHPSPFTTALLRIISPGL